MLRRGLAGSLSALLGPSVRPRTGRVCRDVLPCIPLDDVPQRQQACGPDCGWQRPEKLRRWAVAGARAIPRPFSGRSGRSDGPPHPAQVLRRRRTLSVDAWKAHRAEAKACPEPT